MSERDDSRAAVPTGRLAAVGYQPPATVEQVSLDIVTPTCDRHSQIIEQAALIGRQLTPRDRWIVVDDASRDGCAGPGSLAKLLPSISQLMHLAMSYAKDGNRDSVNRARHVGCSLARSDMTTWIVEIDDHDPPTENCLALVRHAITRGATFLYGDCIWHEGGRDGERYEKPNYKPWLLRDTGSPCEGVRAFPAWLYRSVGGYRWHGKIAVGGNEFPAGDYGLFLRMEQFCEGQGFHRIPEVLCRSVKVQDGISTRTMCQQADMAKKLRRAAQQGQLRIEV